MKALLLPLLSILALCGFRPAPPPSPPYNAGPVQLSLVDRDAGRALPVLAHRGEQWSAGEQGHHYAVRLANQSGERVLVVLSVDGVNAISGEDAAPHQTGYVLRPWQQVEITGWRKSNDEVAQFVFSAPRDSYAVRTGRDANVGVVGVAVFAERRRLQALDEVTVTGSRPAAAQASRRASSTAAAEAMAAPTPALGTAHGERAYAPVRNTAFERASSVPTQISQLRYDSARNLRARGIVLERPVAGERTPQAFPSGFVPDPPRR